MFEKLKKNVKKKKKKFLIFGLCKFFKFEARKFHFLKMTTFKSGFLSFFEFGKLLPEI